MKPNDIADRIIDKKFANRPVIIALDGFGGAGKSTLAKELKSHLGSAYVIEIDDFFLKVVKSDANKSNFDRLRLKEQVLIPFKQGKLAAYQKLHWDTNTLGGYIAIPDSNYVIIEGVSTLHPDIAEYVDYRIWLDIPARDAKDRMIKRDRLLGEDHGELWNHWTESYQMYKDLHHPEMSADLVVKYSDL